jgi:hypothetical protein
MPANGGGLNAEIKDFLQRVAAKKLPREEIFIFFAAIIDDVKEFAPRGASGQGTYLRTIRAAPFGAGFGRP